jgi:insertion element IS1 protein InsB
VIEADELWSFVGAKDNRQWIWAALDADTRRVLAVVVGDRSEFAARCLWLSLPQAYRDRAVFHTDFLPAYRAVLPEERHAAGGKGDGLTSHIERFWCTVRQRCGRFVRKTLSFSKCLENHLGALWFFIHDYNQSRS